MKIVETDRLLHYDDVYGAKRGKAIREHDVDAECKKLWDGRNRRRDYHRGRILTMADIKNPHEREIPIDPDYQTLHHILRDAERNDLRKNEIEKENARDKNLERERMETVHDNVLPLVLENDEINDRSKRQRENVVNIDEDGYDSDTDPQYLNVLDCLKEYGNAYALEDEDSGLIIYEGECSSDDESELKRPRETPMPLRMRTVVSEVNEPKAKPNKWFKQDNRGSVGPSQPYNQKLVQSRKKMKEEVKQEKILKIAVEERDSDDDSAEIEIIDISEVIKEGSCFVPSNTDQSGAGGSNRCADYRRRVLHVLNEPYDTSEYRTLSERVNVFLETFPDLKRKLVKYRYRRGKRLTILRGFFYWLQNNPHDGAFKPWKDAECLSVNPKDLVKT